MSTISPLATHGSSPGAASASSVSAGVAQTRAARARDDHGRLGATLVIAGPLVAIAGGRWGAYIGVTPVFLTDVLTVVGGLFMLVGALRRGSDADRRRMPPVVTAVSALAIGLLLLGLARGGSTDIVAIRDALPFVYLALLPVYVAAARQLGAATVLRWLMYASWFHVLWYAGAVVGVLPLVPVPFVGIEVFTTRGDFDGVVCGIAIATAITVARGSVLIRSVVVALSLVAVLVQGSRAGLISTVLVVLVVGLASRPFGDPRTGPLRLAAAFASVPVLLALGATVLQTSGWARGLERLVGESLSSGEANTTHARVDAWERVIDWVGADGMRQAFGDGFGSSFVADSGAIAFLSGDVLVRQPHSFIVGWYALLGAFGLAVVIVILVMLLVAALRRSLRSPGARLGAAMQVALIFAGAVGVILESPFGYVTYVLAAALAFADDAPSGGGAVTGGGAGEGVEGEPVPPVGREI